MLSMAVARSSSEDIVVHYVLRVLEITSGVHIMARNRQMQRSYTQTGSTGCSMDVTTTTLPPFNDFFSRTTSVSQYQKGKTSLDLNEARDGGVLGCSGIRWTICRQSAPCCRQDNCNKTSSLSFYRPDALPDAQPKSTCVTAVECIQTEQAGAAWTTRSGV